MENSKEHIHIHHTDIYSRTGRSDNRKSTKTSASKNEDTKDKSEIVIYASDIANAIKGRDNMRALKTIAAKKEQRAQDQGLPKTINAISSVNCTNLSSDYTCGVVRNWRLRPGENHHRLDVFKPRRKKRSNSCTKSSVVIVQKAEKRDKELCHECSTSRTDLKKYLSDIRRARRFEKRKYAEASQAPSVVINAQNVNTYQTVHHSNVHRRMVAGSRSIQRSPSSSQHSFSVDSESDVLSDSAGPKISWSGSILFHRGDPPVTSVPPLPVPISTGEEISISVDENKELPNRFVIKDGILYKAIGRYNTENDDFEITDISSRAHLQSIVQHQSNQHLPWTEMTSECPIVTIANNDCQNEVLPSFSAEELILDFEVASEDPVMLGSQAEQEVSAAALTEKSDVETISEKGKSAEAVVHSGEIRPDQGSEKTPSFEGKLATFLQKAKICLKNVSVVKCRDSYEETSGPVRVETVKLDPVRVEDTPIIRKENFIKLEPVDSDVIVIESSTDDGNSPTRQCDTNELPELDGALPSTSEINTPVMSILSPVSSLSKGVDSSSNVRRHLARLESIHDEPRTFFMDESTDSKEADVVVIDLDSESCIEITAETCSVDYSRNRSRFQPGNAAYGRGRRNHPSNGSNILLDRRRSNSSLKTAAARPEKCNSKFGSVKKRSLTARPRFSRPSEKFYVCEICQHKLGTFRALNSHLKTLHNKILLDTSKFDCPFEDCNNDRTTGADDQIAESLNSQQDLYSEDCALKVGGSITPTDEEFIDTARISEERSKCFGVEKQWQPKSDGSKYREKNFFYQRNLMDTFRSRRGGRRAKTKAEMRAFLECYKM